MAQKGNNRGQAPRGVNPQGYNQDTESSMEPKSQLEQKAKKSNTK
ncbi:small, acid-soluble spore protein L [Ferdinandcohnia sp. Marseille-Q9671]